MILTKLKNTLCILLAGLMVCGALPVTASPKPAKTEYTHFETDFNNGEWSGITYSKYEGARIVADENEKNYLYAEINLVPGKGLRIEKTLSYSVKGDFAIEGDFKFRDGATGTADKTRRNVFTILDSAGTTLSPVIVNQGVITGGGKKLCMRCAVR